VIRTASPHDLPALRALFERANDAPYDLADVAEEKCFGRGVAGQPCARVWGNGDVAGGIGGAVVTCGRHVRILAVDRDARRRGIGSALLNDAEERGASFIAAEAGNYFTPGVVDTDVAATQFLRARGYIETRFTHNLDVALPPRRLDARRLDDLPTRNPTAS
jgi:GNAT superfamily N-acetyltransferase